MFSIIEVAIRPNGSDSHDVREQSLLFRIEAVVLEHRKRVLRIDFLLRSTTAGFVVEVTATLRAKTGAVFAAKHHERQSKCERTLKKSGKVDLVLIDKLVVFDFFSLQESGSSLPGRTKYASIALRDRAPLRQDTSTSGLSLPTHLSRCEQRSTSIGEEEMIAQSSSKR